MRWESTGLSDTRDLRGVAWVGGRVPCLWVWSRDNGWLSSERVALVGVCKIGILVGSCSCRVARVCSGGRPVWVDRDLRLTVGVHGGDLRRVVSDIMVRRRWTGSTWRQSAIGVSYCSRDHGYLAHRGWVLVDGGLGDDRGFVDWTFIHMSVIFNIFWLLLLLVLVLFDGVKRATKGTIQGGGGGCRSVVFVR